MIYVSWFVGWFIFESFRISGKKYIITYWINIERNVLLCPYSFQKTIDDIHMGDNV